MGRTPCCDKNGLKKGPWTQEEDQKLMQYIQIHGPGNWRNLPKNAGLQRCGKSCRLRWTNYLRPDIKRGRFSFEEEETIIQLHSVLGNKWSAIAARLPGRTDNEIKNYWNTHIRKRLLRMGIDPVTHSPRLDFLDLSSLINSAQLNLSNFLGLQTLVNPDVVRLATFLASNPDNPELVLQKLQENQIYNTQLQNTASMIPSTQFQNPNQDIPSSSMNANMGLFSDSMMNSTGQIIQENLGPSNLQENYVAPPNYEYCVSDQDKINNVLENSNFCFDSLMSTPLSSSTPLSTATPMTSSSTFINSSSTEDERESYCSKLFKFEIPEGLEFDDFM